MPRSAAPSKAPPSLPTASGSPELNRHALYELCAQNPTRDAKLLRAIYAHFADVPASGLVLGEDFCAAAALSRAWCGLSPKFKAVGVDHDQHVLDQSPKHPRVTLHTADVRKVTAKVDLIAVQNFSICELHHRRDLMAYLKHARSRLKSGRLFICDIYGGSDAFLTGTLPQKVAIPSPAPKGIPPKAQLTYTWEQRTADPFTGRVVNAMHFTLRQSPKAGSGRKSVELHDAFVYDWRLWSVPELREALLEAGFASVDVFPRVPDALDSSGHFHVQPVMDPQELSDSFNVYIVGRA